jgi:hypothetical protein
VNLRLFGQPIKGSAILQENFFESWLNHGCVQTISCTLSAYHESSCCRAPACGCWCHERNKEVEDLKYIISSFAEEIEEEESEREFARRQLERRRQLGSWEAVIEEMD